MMVILTADTLDNMIWCPSSALVGAIWRAYAVGKGNGSSHQKPAQNAAVSARGAVAAAGVSSSAQPVPRQSLDSNEAFLLNSQNIR